jgi:hypothetical protein
MSKLHDHDRTVASLLIFVTGKKILIALRIDLEDF